VLNIIDAEKAGNGFFSINYIIPSPGANKPVYSTNITELKIETEQFLALKSGNGIRSYR
jgi:hypothetical protein